MQTFSHLKMPLALALIFITLLPSCRKDDDLKKVEKATDMVIPKGFLFETQRKVDFRVAVTDGRFDGMVHLISVYDKDPAEGGQLLLKGGATVSKPFTGTLDLEKIIQSVYVTKTSPDGSKSAQTLAVGSNRVELTFASFGNGPVSSRNSPDCNTGCTNTYHNQNNQNLNLNSGVTCLTGTFSGNVNLNSTAELRICGNATIGNLNLNGQNTKLIITSSGTMTTSSNLSIGGAVSNFGTLTINGEFNVNSNGSFLNEGTMSVAGTIHVNSSTTSVNSGTLTAQRLTVNSNGVLQNYCSIVLSNQSTVNGNLANHGYIKCNNEWVVNSNSQLVLHSGSMLSVTNTTIQGTVAGSGSTSLYKVTNSTTIRSNGVITGPIQFCDLNGIETNQGSFTNGAEQACTVYIPTSSCNAEGNGAPPVQDGDGDGVPDDQDDFPDFPEGAFSNFYPSQGQTHSLVFEDLWPNYGDFDMNDMVIDFSHNMVTNAENKVVQVRSRFVLRAAGGSLKTAFAVEYPILRGNVTGLVGGVLESDGTYAVIQVFDDSKAYMPKFNTEPGVAHEDSVVFEVVFNLTTPVALQNIGLGVYNPFIWLNAPGYGRGHEIHLPGKLPTSQANTATFGTGQDDTNPAQGKYYLSKSNLPWAIHVPQRFAYPIEKADITQTYLHFATWAQSGGTQYQDWYKNQSGYVDATKVYGQ